MNDNIKDLVNENELLKIENKKLHEILNSQKWFIAKIFILPLKMVFGPKFYKAFEDWFNEVEKQKIIPLHESRVLIIAFLRRLSLLGGIGFVLGVIPTVLLILQTCLLSTQNSKIENQNKLLAQQNEQIKNQNELLESQNKNTIKQNELLDTQNEKINIQCHLSESARRSQLIFELSSIYDQVSSESEAQKNTLHDQKQIILSDSLIGRIISISYSLNPYFFINYDEDHYDDDQVKKLTLNEKILSPERGQLLIFLVHSNVSLESFISRCNFKYSSLHGADLQGANLNGINLSGSDLSNSNLTKTSLYGANLTDACLKDTIIKESNLKNIIINKHFDFEGTETLYKSKIDKKLFETIKQNNAILLINRDELDQYRIFLEEKGKFLDLHKKIEEKIKELVKAIVYYD